MRYILGLLPRALHHRLALRPGITSWRLALLPGAWRYFPAPGVTSCRLPLLGDDTPAQSEPSVSRCQDDKCFIWARNAAMVAHQTYDRGS